MDIEKDERFIHPPRGVTRIWDFIIICAIKTLPLVASMLKLPALKIGETVWIWTNEMSTSCSMNIQLCNIQSDKRRLSSMGRLSCEITCVFQRLNVIAQYFHSILIEVYEHLIKLRPRTRIEMFSSSQCFIVWIIRQKCICIAQPKKRSSNEN